MAPKSSHLLARLAKAYGLETSYEDAQGVLRNPSPEILLAALRALGASLASEAEAESALREKQLRDFSRPLEPVSVHWQGMPFEIQLCLPESTTDNNIPVLLRMESGEIQRLKLRADNASILARESVEGTYYHRKLFRLKTEPPPGIHNLLLETSGRLWKSTLICAPSFAYSDPQAPQRRWGLFLPLYALYSKDSLGAGDFGDLEKWMEWTRAQGGHAVAALPLLSSYLNQPCDPSPYSPVSRLFYNEFYLDLEILPDLAICPEARAILNSPEWETLRQESLGSRLIDYRRLMSAKRRVLELLATSFFQKGPNADFQAFLNSYRQAELYARFRATTETRAETWPQWPDRLRLGELREGDYKPDSRNYHLYVQWQTEKQLHRLSVISKESGPMLYLDLPLGIHPEGYDAWHERELFAKDFTVGAPPDAFFSRGQNWGFPPLLPEASRGQGHAYFLETLRRQMAVAGMLRIDHVMGLHRLFWIPRGASPREGCYITYPAEEFYALLCLQSQRSRCLLVGEDLGTVPPEVRPAMASHHMLRSYVAPFEWEETSASLREAPKESVACLNTHDMPTFAGFWEGHDLQDRTALGLMDEISAASELKQRLELKMLLERDLKFHGNDRASPLLPLLKALLFNLAAGEASWLVINLEDLWGEIFPQNVPGTHFERPNWRRRAAHPLEKIELQADVLDILRKIRDLRP